MGGALTVTGLTAKDARVTTFIVECYSDSGLTTLAASGAAPSVFDPVSGLALQVGTIVLNGLTNGTTYYLRSCASIPAYGLGAWSPTQSAVAGLDASSPVMVGDTGSGGTAGLAPAPGAGDAAAQKYLKADGIWTVPLQPTRGNNSNGYWVKDVGGYIHQWGSVATAATGGTTVNFPIPYTNAASVSVTVTADFGQTAGATMDVMAGTVNTTYFTLMNYGGTSGNTFWQSDGY